MMAMLQTDRPAPTEGADAGPPGPVRPPMVLLLGLAGIAAGILVWASASIGPRISESEPPEIPPLSEEAPDEATEPEPVPPTASIQSLVPGLTGTVWFVMPAAGGTAELWHWPPPAAAPLTEGPVPDARLVEVDPTGRWVAAIGFEGDLALGTSEKRAFQGPGTHSLAWHPAGDGRIAWLAQPPNASSAELWTAQVGRGGVFSRRLAVLPGIVLGTPELGDGGFLVAYGDWGFVVERSLPTEWEEDIVVGRSQVTVLDPEGRPSGWVEGRLIAAAPDGRLLIGQLNVLSGAYRLELTDPELSAFERVPWISIGETVWSPDGGKIFNVVDNGPPKARFDIMTEEESTRFALDVQFVDPLGWSPDGRWFLLGAIVPDEGRKLIVVDTETGSLTTLPIERLPRAAGVTPAG